jgi:predicted metal-binding membrane protein
VVLGALATVTAAAWAYLLLGAGIEMEAMDMGGRQMMAMLPVWGPGYTALISVMWWVMMVAMMLPTAAPAVLLVTPLGAPMRMDVDRSEWGAAGHADAIPFSTMSRSGPFCTLPVGVRGSASSRCRNSGSL